METYSSLKARIFNLQQGKGDFELLALEVFRYQAKHNPLYSKFLQLIHKDVLDIHTIQDIPMLPISLFKQYAVKTGDWEEETVFTSSGTTGTTPSKHYVRSMQHYLDNCKANFEYHYGQVENYCWLALLPSYLERSGSSLVCMAKRFIEQSNYAQESGFFLHDIEGLRQMLIKVKTEKIPTILLGVSFALLDFVEVSSMDIGAQTIIMETGGMKGRREEKTRTEIHEVLKEGFQVPKIHSEYGMTELFSQAYSQGDGVFYPSPTMKPFIRETNDPFYTLEKGRAGVLHIVDLANLDTCCFIATEDIGRIQTNGSFEVLGRLDTSEIRGCNLMLADV